jgi:hypothetical protein
VILGEQGKVQLKSRRGGIETGAVAAEVLIAVE